ncbi:hypothetical protein SPBR_02558 [Sporothrix brasiliensis 5110]|uniref:Uncharacterized protein n=1 Tax=Sporothrix brasiliensis 5110 TaxID=1398154 RepID=A0A0C2IU14_9PEZI|nr:uncharacterized protein SPBR_02558 [Sporothrix brasiliensis 5110]KIH92591.1 hypothetical protein SPBR_02558 [Sporothrix brasiliensis 5110]
MFFSKYVPVLGALVAGVQASPAPITPVGNSLVSRSPSKTSFDLSKSYDQATLFSGLAPAAENGLANVNLHLGLPNAHITGNVDVELNANFILEPTVIINLGGVEAYIELDVKADAKVFEAAELVTSGKLSIDIPGLLDVEAGLALALDLVICLDAAIDLSAGFYVNFPQGSFIEVNVLTSKVVRHQLDDLNARTLPLTLGADVDLNVDVELEVGLRLRTELGIDANVDPLGIPLLSAGAEVAVWINLFDYTSVIIGHPSHPRPPSCANNAVTEAFALDVGIIVALDVDVLDIVDLDLAPTISVTLASAPIATNCIPPCAGCQHSASSSAATSTVTATSVPASSAGASSLPASSTGASTATHISSGATTVTSTDNAASSSYTKTVVSHSGSTVTKTLSNGSGASSTGSAGPISSATVKGPQSLTTSTYFETSTVTITSCAASVVNCPASYTQKVVTEIVVAKTTVCPVAAASSAAYWRGNATVSTAAATTTHGPVVVTVPAKCSNTVTFSTIPASSATSNTFTAPTSVSVVGTVTLTGAKQATVTPTAVAAPTVASTGGSKLITAQPSASKPGYSSPSNLPVTAAAAGVSATHINALLALVAGIVLAL